MVRDAEQMSAGHQPEFAAVAAVRDGPRPVGIAEGPDALPLQKLCPALALVKLAVLLMAAVGVSVGVPVPPRALVRLAVQQQEVVQTKPSLEQLGEECHHLRVRRD